MLHKPVLFNVPFRHRFWAIFHQLLLLALLESSLCAANLPTFTYYLVNTEINAVVTDSAGNTYMTGATTAGGINATPGAFQSQDHSVGLCGTHPALYTCTDSFVVK